MIALEHALEAIPYLSEGYVVAVPDHEANQLCGALVRVQKDNEASEKITLTKIRSDLSDQHPTYMLPVLLRVLQDGEEVPLTVSQKPIRNEIVKKYFLVGDYWSVEKPTPGVECGDNEPEGREHIGAAWDWAGLQS